MEVKLAVSKPADNIRQSAYLCYEPQKLLIVKHMFEQETPHRVIIFVGSKKKTKELAISIIRAGYNARAMHSDLLQAERDEVMHLFRSGKVDVLVATDIVARGIDIDDIAIVINFDVPRDEEDYVHRIGRTARAGRGGRAVTLVNEKDMHFFRQIERFLGKEIHKEQMPAELGELNLEFPIRFLDSSVTVKAWTVVSPVLVRNTSPFKPTISPISIFLKAL